MCYVCYEYSFGPHWHTWSWCMRGDVCALRLKILLLNVGSRSTNMDCMSSYIFVGSLWRGFWDWQRCVSPIVKVYSRLEKSVNSSSGTRFSIKSTWFATLSTYKRRVEQWCNGLGIVDWRGIYSWRVYLDTVQHIGCHHCLSFKAYLVTRTIDCQRCGLS